jgi:hypothetical protein
MPWLEPETAGWQVLPESVKIDDDFEKLSVHVRQTLPIRLQRSRIGVDQILVDMGKINGSKRSTYVVEEAPSAVEQLAKAGRRQP